MADEDGRSNEGLPNILPVPKSELKALFASNADIGHRIFADASLNGLVARQSIFPGAIFRKCTIDHCDFSRSDFEGVRFEKCKIIGTSFESCDIRSTLFADCEVASSNFNGAYFSDNLFKGGSLTSTAFDHSTVTANQFVSTRISNISNERSTMLHNDFLSSELDGIKLGDCTALYTYFQDCRFTNFRINADSLGLSFGLTLRDLEAASLIFLGRDEQKPVSFELVDQLIAEFENRRWGLHSIVVGLNFGRVDPVKGWSVLFEYLRRSIVAGGIRLDDISFVLHIAERLAPLERLPFFPIISAHDALAEVILPDDGLTTEARALQRLRNGLLSLISNMQARFIKGAAPLNELTGNTSASLDLVFGKRPEVHPGEYIQYLLHETADRAVPLRILGSGPGSWHEVLQTVVATAFTLYAVLFLVEGSLIKLLLIRARAAQLAASQIPKKFIEKANDPQQMFPRDLLKVMRPLIDGLSTGSLRLPPPQSGLTRKNLRQIVVKPLAKRRPLKPSAQSRKSSKRRGVNRG